MNTLYEFKMLKWYTLCLFLTAANCDGHRARITEDADLQTAMMPQELNPEFIPNKDALWKNLMPYQRQRRKADPEISVSTQIGQQLKWYSRVTASIVLAVATVIEIVLYVVEAYGNNNNNN